MATIAERSRKYRERNKAKAVAASIRWQKKNPDKVKAARKRSYDRKVLRPEFLAKRRVLAKAYYAANRDRCVAAMRANKLAHPDRELARTVGRYGLSLDQFSKMLTKQGGLCAICRGKNPFKNGRFHVDHDHATKKVRGLLCHRCNVGLGNFRDTPDLLEAAARYLRMSA